MDEMVELPTFGVFMVAVHDVVVGPFASQAAAAEEADRLSSRDGSAPGRVLEWVPVPSDWWLEVPSAR